MCLSSDELDDDVFYPDDFEFSGEPLTSSTPMFTHSPPYNCLLGRFQLFTVSHCCGPGCRIAELKDKATQTLEPSSLNGDIMLPWGVSESPQRLFYGKRQNYSSYVTLKGLPMLMLIKCICCILKR